MNSRLFLFLLLMIVLTASSISAMAQTDTLMKTNDLAIEVAEKLQASLDSVQAELKVLKTQKNELLDKLAAKEQKIAAIGAVLALFFCFMSLFLFMFLRLRRRVRIDKEEAASQQLDSAGK